VPSPQSNNQSSALWGNLKATLETLRALVGTPELVPKNVICTAFFSLPLAELDALFYIVAWLLSFHTFGIEEVKAIALEIHNPHFSQTVGAGSQI
jgi:hypothetical protein